MFSRNPEKDGPAAPQQSAPNPTQMPAAAAAGPTLQRTARPSTSGGNEMTSVIGSDLTIIGSGLKIIAQRTLQVDGEIQGDVMGSSVIIGQSGKVTGLVNAENVKVNGAVHGTIKGVNVVITSTAAVEGDIFHQTLALEQGAAFDGRSRRPKDQAELVPDLSGAAESGQPQPHSSAAPATPAPPASAANGQAAAPVAAAPSPAGNQG